MGQNGDDEKIMNKIFVFLFGMYNLVALFHILAIRMTSNHSYFILFLL